VDYRLIKKDKSYLCLRAR